VFLKTRSLFAPGLWLSDLNILAACSHGVKQHTSHLVKSQQLLARCSNRSNQTFDKGNTARNHPLNKAVRSRPVATWFCMPLPFQAAIFHNDWNLCWPGCDSYEDLFPQT